MPGRQGVWDIAKRAYKGKTNLDGIQAVFDKMEPIDEDDDEIENGNDQIENEALGAPGRALREPERALREPERALREPEQDALAIVPLVPAPVEWLQLSSQAVVPDLFKATHTSIGLIAVLIIEVPILMFVLDCSHPESMEKKTKSWCIFGAFLFKNAPKVHPKCTTHPPKLHQKCTISADIMHSKCLFLRMLGLQQRVHAGPVEPKSGLQHGRGLSSHRGFQTHFP